MEKIEEKFISILLSTYNRIIRFNEFNTFTPEHLMNIIDPTNRYSFLRYAQLIITDIELSKALYDKQIRFGVAKKYNNEIRKIIQFFSNSGIHSILTTEYHFSMEIYKYRTFVNHKMDELLAEFNFLEIERTIEDYIQKEKTDMLNKLMQKSRFYFDIGNPLIANENVQKAKILAYENNDFTNYSLAVYNQKRIFGHIWRNSLSPFKIETEQIFNLRDEIFELDINEHYDEFFNGDTSYEQMKYYLTINDIYSNKVMYDYIIKMRNLLKSIHDDKRLFMKGGCTLRSPQLSNIAYFDLNVILKFIEANNIIYNFTSDNIEFFRLFCEAIYVRHQIDLLLPEIEYLKKEINYYIELKEIDYYTLYLTIWYFLKDELKNLFERIDLTKIKISKDTKKQLIKAFENLLKFITSVKWKTERLLFIEFYISNFITIFDKTGVKFGNKKVLEFSETLAKNGVDSKYFKDIDKLIEQE